MNCAIATPGFVVNSNWPFATPLTVKISPASASSGSVALRSVELNTTVAPSATVRLLLIRVGASLTPVTVRSTVAGRLVPPSGSSTVIVKPAAAVSPPSCRNVTRLSSTSCCVKFVTVAPESWTTPFVVPVTV